MFNVEKDPKHNSEVWSLWWRCSQGRRVDKVTLLKEETALRRSTAPEIYGHLANILRI